MSIKILVTMIFLSGALDIHAHFFPDIMTDNMDSDHTETVFTNNKVGYNGDYRQQQTRYIYCSLKTHS